MNVIERMEKAIDAERDPVRRWAMRKVLKNTIKTMEKPNKLNQEEAI